MTVLISAVFILILILISNKTTFKKLQISLQRQFQLKQNSTTILAVTIYIISILIYPVVKLLLFVFWLNQVQANYFLKKHFGESYGGLIKSNDMSLLVCQPQKDYIMNVLLLVKHSERKSAVKHIKEFLRNNFFENRKLFPKITYCCGKYSYCRFLFDGNMTVDDVVFEINVKEKKVTKEVLRKLIKERSRRNLEKALWEICIVTKPVDWRKEESFPLILRVNHGVTDGIGLLLLMKNYLSDDSLENYWKPKFDKSEETILCKLKKLQEKICVDLLAPLVSIYLLVGDDRNDLCRKRSGNCIFAWFLEKDQQLLDKIRKIRYKIPGVTFMDVTKTVLTVCLREYFKRHSYNIPNQITVMETVNSRTHSDSKISLENHFTMAQNKLPVNFTVNTLQHLTSEIHNQSDTIQKSIEPQVYFWMQRLNLPEFLVQFVVDRMTGTMFLTNLPGLKELSFCKRKFQVDDMLIWIPHRGPIGFTLLVHTFGNRLQLGLCADESNVKNEEELDAILSDFIAYLQAINLEVEERT